jgi:hypothetical protein
MSALPRRSNRLRETQQPSYSLTRRKRARHSHSEPGQAESDAKASFDTLPLELFDEILSHFPPPLPFPIAPRSPYDDDAPLLSKPFEKTEPRLERTAALRALSQTCHYFRRLTLAMAWERIEAVAVSSTDLSIPNYQKKWEKELAKELIRQLEIVTVRNPSLAQHVK